MFGPTSRLLRSTGALLGFAFSVPGCQSVTQQKAAWSFPPFREGIEDRPIVAENPSLPPLPADYGKWVEDRNSSGSQIAADKRDMKPDLYGSRVSPPLLDASIVRSSTVRVSTQAKSSAGVERGFLNAGGMPQSRSAVDGIDRSASANSKPIFTVSERNDGSTANSPVPGMAGADAAPIEPPPALPVPMDPQSTRQIVKRIVGVSDDLTRTSVELDTEDDELNLPSIARPMLDHGREVPEKPNSAPARLDSARATAASSSPARPPLETIPAEGAKIVEDRSRTPPSKPPISIPRAAICKSVEGRGRFVALPEPARVPGAPMIIYWEMDKLTRDQAGRGVALTVLVELVMTDRDEILASARETVRDSGPEPAEGDFAALRWRIPVELAPGDYRIRISVTEASTGETATTQLDFPVGRPPVASRFVLP